MQQQQQRSCIPLRMIAASHLFFLTILTAWTSYSAAFDPLFREISVVNTCGCSLILSSVIINDGDNDKSFVKQAEIANGTEYNTTGYVGEELQVMEIANATGNCTDRAASFQVNDNYYQVVYIEQGLQVFVEDDMTIRNNHQRLNDDFSLFYEMISLSSPKALLKDHNMRMVWQQRLFRNSPIVGLVENKLLCHSLLVSLGIPKAEIYYGAFASKAMGEWPQYDRDDFIATLSKVPQVSVDHLFVIKPASGENAAGTIIMNHKKWINGGWSLDRLADHVEDLFSVTESSWGQKYEHLGVMVQQSVLTQDSNTEFFKGSFDTNSFSLVYEIKSHVVFDGFLCGGSLNLVPFNPEYHMNIDFCHGEPRLVHEMNNSAWDEAIKSTLQGERLAKTAKRIANAFALDFFRLDVFMDLNGMFLVNEVTYPSVEHPAWDCTFTRLYSHYKHDTFEVLEPRSVLEYLLGRIGVQYDEFIETTDYRLMTDWSEEKWDSFIASYDYD